MHSIDQFRRGVISHIGTDGSDLVARINRSGFPWNAVGENVASGQETPESVFQAWMASPGHRANILNPAFQFVGNAQNSRFWTQLFAGKRGGSCSGAGVAVQLFDTLSNFARSANVGNLIQQGLGALGARVTTTTSVPTTRTTTTTTRPATTTTTTTTTTATTRTIAAATSTTIINALISTPTSTTANRPTVTARAISQPASPTPAAGRQTVQVPTSENVRTGRIALSIGRVDFPLVFVRASAGRVFQLTPVRDGNGVRFATSLLPPNDPSNPFK